MTQEPTGEKVVIIQSVLGWLAAITPAKAVVIALLAMAGANVAIAVRVQDPSWRAANLFPRAVSREKVPGGCVLQTFHLDGEPDVVLIYRFAARGEALYNLGYEADFLRSKGGGAEAACGILRTIADRLEKESAVPK